MDGEDLEQALFCYFILGSAFPAIWGFFFLMFSFYSGEEINDIAPSQPGIELPKACVNLNFWGLSVAAVFFAIATFYLVLMAWSLISTAEYDYSSQYLNLEAQHPKLAKTMRIEENWIRILIVFFVFLLFTTFGFLQQIYGTEQLRECGNLYKLGELFFYIICGICALIGVACLFICQSGINPEEANDNQEPMQQRQVRYAHHYGTIEDIF